MEYELFESLKTAYETSTPSHNWFNELLSKVKWDCQFKADGDFYFVKGGFTFTTPVLNPFDHKDWKPSALFSDGSLIEF